MTTSPGANPDRARDLARLRELTDPHMPHPAAPIGPALVHRSLGDRAEVMTRTGPDRPRLTMAESDRPRRGVIASLPRSRSAWGLGALFAGFAVGLLVSGKPWQLPPAWGDIPTWISATATVGLLIGAIFTVIYAIKAFGAQAGQLAILVEESRREAYARLLAQAEQVFTGTPQSTEQSLGVVPHVRNASGLPAYNAQLWYSDYEGVAGPDTLGAIMPDEEVTASNNRIFSSRDSALSKVILTFVDAAGFRWIRMPDGAISQQSRPTPLESVEAALRPELPTCYVKLADQIADSVADAIAIYPRSHGVLQLPGEFSSSVDPAVNVNSPPARRVITTSEDGSTQGVYWTPRHIDDPERFELIWDVWNQRNGRVFAKVILTDGMDSD